MRRVQPHAGRAPVLPDQLPDGGKSWEYDALTGLWGPVQYGLSGRARSRRDLLDYINKPRLFDYSNGNIYTIDPTLYTGQRRRDPLGAGLAALLRGLQPRDREQALRRLRERRGPRDRAGLDPQVMLRVSRDGGHSWGNELRASMGKIGEYTKRATFPPLGTARDFVFELSITDPVKRVIVGAASTTRRGRMNSALPCARTCRSWWIRRPGSRSPRSGPSAGRRTSTHRAGAGVEPVAHGTKTHDFGNIAAHTEASTTVTVVGARTMDTPIVIVTPSANTAGIHYKGVVTAMTR
jgi:hypothetical protein